MGNPHLRFDEGRAGRTIRVALSPTPPPPTQVEERAGRTTPFSSSAMSSDRLFLDRDCGRDDHR